MCFGFLLKNHLFPCVFGFVAEKHIHVCFGFVAEKQIISMCVLVFAEKPRKHMEKAGMAPKNHMEKSKNKIS